MERLMLGLCAVLAVAGCRPGAQEAAEDAAAAGKERCGAEALQHLVGRPRDAFDAGAHDGPLRILPPDAMMTMDHRPERLNVSLDEDGRITRIWCG